MSNKTRTVWMTTISAGSAAHFAQIAPTWLVNPPGTRNAGKVRVARATEFDHGEARVRFYTNSRMYPVLEYLVTDKVSIEVEVEAMGASIDICHNPVEYPPGAFVITEQFVVDVARSADVSLHEVPPGEAGNNRYELGGSPRQVIAAVLTICGGDPDGDTWFLCMSAPDSWGHGEGRTYVRLNDLRHEDA